MNTDQLRYFLSVARHRNFTGAARESIQAQTTPCPVSVMERGFFHAQPEGYPARNSEQDVKHHEEKQT